MIRRALILALVVGLLAGCGERKLTDAQAVKAARAHYQLGIQALNSGLLPKAFDELMTADRLNPGQPEVLDALAFCWRLRGDLKKSEAYYRKSLRAERRAATLNNYANLKIEMKQYREAKRLLMEALEDPRYPNQGLVYLNLGDAEAGLGHFDEALKAYRQAAVFMPASVIPKLREARLYARFGRPNMARATFEAVLKDNPGDRAVVEAYLDYLIQQGDTRRAKEILREFAVQAKGLDAAWARDELARLYRR